MSLYSEAGRAGGCPGCTSPASTSPKGLQLHYWFCLAYSAPALRPTNNSPDSAKSLFTPNPPLDISPRLAARGNETPRETFPARDKARVLCVVLHWRTMCALYVAFLCAFSTFHYLSFIFTGTILKFFHFWVSTALYSLNILHYNCNTVVCKSQHINKTCFIKFEFQDFRLLIYLIGFGFLKFLFQITWDYIFSYMYSHESMANIIFT